jgi:hypothetical protein
VNFNVTVREEIFNMLENCDDDHFKILKDMRAVNKYHLMTKDEFIGMFADHERGQHMKMATDSNGGTEWIFLSATRPNAPPTGVVEEKKKKGNWTRKSTSEQFEKLKAKLSDDVFSARFRAKACLNCGKLDHHMHDCTVATVERAMICQAGEDQGGIDEESSAAPVDQSTQAARAIAALTVGPRLLCDGGW